MTKSMRRLFAALFVLLVLCWLIFITGCGYAKHEDPPVYMYDSNMLSMLSAQFNARDVHGEVEMVTNPEGSMLPLIEPGDLLVVAYTPFSEKLLGKVCTYRPVWNNRRNTVHRMTAWDHGGFIASGDHNALSEPNERVTAANYVGEVVGIYRVKK